MTEFINIGFGNLISSEKIIAVVTPDAAPVKRLVSQAKENDLLVDASCGRKTQSVIVFNSNHIVLSALTPKQINSRINGEEE